MIRQCNPREEDGDEQGDDDGGTPEAGDDGGTSEDDDDEGDDDEGDDDEGALEFAIETLPFYLSRADYNPNLAIYARSLLSQKIGERRNIPLQKIRLFHEAIHLYLKVSF